MKYLQALIILCVVAAVAAVLILPQVDLPDAVINSARVQMTTLAHASSGSLFAGNILSELSSQATASHGSQFVREASEHLATDVHSVLILIHTLRC
jgi:hypothetical protein